jgi:hypothetical protein
MLAKFCKRLWLKKAGLKNSKNFKRLKELIKLIVPV